MRASQHVLYGAYGVSVRDKALERGRHSRGKGKSDPIDAHLAVLAQGLRDAGLVIFENSSHMAFIEEREAYIRVVDDFLGRVEAGTADEA